MQKEHLLKYSKPADPNVWEQALPIGNGYMGAMIYGGISEDIIKLNQESVWFGGPRDRINPSALDALDRIRKAVFEGQLAQAEEDAYKNLFGTPMSMGHYEPLCDLKLVFDQKIPHHSERNGERSQDVTHYLRYLDLKKGTHTVVYDQNGSHYKRDIFMSYPQNVMVIQLSQLGNGSLSLRLELERSDMAESIFANDSRMFLEGQSGGKGSRFACGLEVETVGGKVISEGAYLTVQKARKVLIKVTSTTDYYGHDPKTWCSNTLDTVKNMSYKDLYEEHMKDYQALYASNDLQIGEISGALDTNDLYSLPDTDKSVQTYLVNQSDHWVSALMYHYGRYLLMSSSRMGTLPANLQGIWNQEMMPPWGCKYTININTQMNYWMADVTGLSTCNEPLFKHLKRMAPNGKKVARQMYGVEGLVAHHNTDIYGDCSPQDQWMPATIWPMGFAWLATHLIEHYRFKKDTLFIREYYDILLECSRFYTEFLIKDSDNQWVTNPSVSPENTYVLPSGEKSALCYGPTMDTQIIKHLWEGFLEISEVLGVQNDVTEKVIQMMENLPKETIGSRGQLLEWTKEYDEWEKGHRHISHLYGLHPGNSIQKDLTPALFEAAKVTLKERLSEGGGHTGWSRAWIINFYARLFMGDEALTNILALLDHSLAPNLFDMHPPFQIDGNFGLTAGIAEMLVQSHEEIIKLLPACPKSWDKGHVKGLIARGNIKIDMTWQDKKVTAITLESKTSQVAQFLINGQTHAFALIGDIVHEYTF